LCPSALLGFPFYTSCFFLEFLCLRSIFYNLLALLITCPIQTVYPINQVFLLQLVFPSHSISFLMSTQFSLIGYLTIKATWASFRSGSTNEICFFLTHLSQLIQTVYPINQVFLLQLVFPSHSISSLMSTHFGLIGYLIIKATWASFTIGSINEIDYFLTHLLIVSNLIIKLLIAIHILFWIFFFQFHPLEFDFYINFGPHFYDCYLLFSYHFFNWNFLSIKFDLHCFNCYLFYLK